MAAKAAAPVFPDAPVDASMPGFDWTVEDANGLVISFASRSEAEDGLADAFAADPDSNPELVEPVYPDPKALTDAQRAWAKSIGMRRCDYFTWTAGRKSICAKYARPLEEGETFEHPRCKPHTEASAYPKKATQKPAEVLPF